MFVRPFFNFTNLHIAVLRSISAVNRHDRKELINEGKAKRLYQIDKPDLLIQEFKDDATAFNGKKRGKIKDKGALNNEISSFLFEYLEGYHIPTHFVKKLSDSEMLVKKLEVIPLEVVVRNIAAGSLCKRYGVKEGLELQYPIIEHYLKSDQLGDPPLNEYHIYAFCLALPEELKTVNRMASKVNAVLKSFFERRGIKLVDFKLEFGRHKGQILLGDEISPDTCRFWDTQTDKKLDKDRFRQDLGDSREAYVEIRDRVCKKVA